jgi:hypothetical protein
MPSATLKFGDLYLGEIHSGTFSTLWGYSLSKVLAIPFTHDELEAYLRDYLESYSSMYLSVPTNQGDATQRALAKKRLSGQLPSSMRWLYFVIVDYSEAADYLRDYLERYSYQVSTSQSPDSLMAEKGQERIKILTVDAAQALQSFKAILEKDRSDELCEELSKRKPVLSIYLNFKTNTKENEELIRVSSELSKMKLSNSRNVYVNN